MCSVLVYEPQSTRSMRATECFVGCFADTNGCGRGKPVIIFPVKGGAVSDENRSRGTTLRNGSKWHFAVGLSEVAR